MNKTDTNIDLINKLKKGNLFFENQSLNSDDYSKTDWVIISDYNDRIVFVNQCLIDFMNTNGFAKNIIGEKISSVFPFITEEDLIENKKMLTEKNELIFEKEYNVFEKKLQMHNRIIPVINNGKLIQMIIIINELANNNQENNKTGHTQESEKELNSMKSNFLSVVSHEFRTPLAGILSSTQLLQKYYQKWETEKNEKYLNQIVESVNYVTNILDHLSVIETDANNTITLKPVSVDISEFLEAIINENKMLFNTEVNIHKSFNLQEREHYIDKNLIRYIIGNILNNAIKFTQQSNEIFFSVDDNSQNLIFIITDFGIGIPSGEQTYIFEPFYRASNTENIKGTGFGLSIVKRMIDLYNGKIFIKSQINKGTSITIILPKIEKEK
ncbi:MAG TPA: HAMP domain-containing sensor histidine kinase [Bacteroidales bacterium]|nr:HAMP domain-containing sensor histidine kinase [Bacteroidales bacterium]